MRLQTLVASSFLFLLGCSMGTGQDALLEGPDPDATGRVSFELQSPVGVAFRLMLYRTPPESLADDPYFASECLTQLDGFTVQSLKEGSDYVAVFLQYSKNTCDDATLIGVGIRGDISVTDRGTGSAYYYIQVNLLDAMTALPLPPESLRSPEEAGSVVACKTHDECREPCKATGICMYPKEDVRFHPAAVCEAERCRLPSLFPLNTRLPRAFHASLPLADGTVALIGGMNVTATRTGSTTGTRLSAGNVAGTTTVEGFDPMTALFSERGSDVLMDVTGAMGPAVATLDGRIAMFANATCMDLLATCPEASLKGACPARCNTQSTVSLILADPDTEATVSVPLAAKAKAIVLAANVVDANGAGQILALPGLLTVDELASAATNAVMPLLCSPDAKAASDCVVLEGASNVSPRFRPAGVCLTETAGLCQRYVVVGGNVPQSAGLVEQYREGAWSAVAADTAYPPPNALFGTELFAVGTYVLALGGVDRTGSPVEMTGLRFTTAGGKDQVSAVKVNFKDVTGSSLLGKGLLKRIHHRVTPLGPDSLLITGGVDPSRQPFTTALRCTVATDATTGITLTCSEFAALPRWAHTATRIPSGLLANSVLLTGGLAQGDGLEFAEAAEIFLQRPEGL